MLAERWLQMVFINQCKCGLRFYNCQSPTISPSSFVQSFLTRYCSFRLKSVCLLLRVRGNFHRKKAVGLRLPTAISEKEDKMAQHGADFVPPFQPVLTMTPEQRLVHNALPMDRFLNIIHQTLPLKDIPLIPKTEPSKSVAETKRGVRKKTVVISVERQKMEDDSAKLKDSWINTHNPSYREDAAAVREYIERKNKEDAAEMEKYKAENKLEVVNHAKTMNFHRRDEIKNVNKCLLEIEALYGQGTQHNHHKNVEAKWAARDVSILKGALAEEDRQAEKERLQKLHKRQRLKEDSDAMLALINSKKVGHDFDLLRKQTARIKQYNEDLKKEDMEEKRELAAAKEAQMEDLEERYKTVEQTRIAEANAEDFRKLLRHEHVKRKVSSLKNLVAYQRRRKSEKDERIHRVYLVAEEMEGKRLKKASEEAQSSLEHSDYADAYEKEQQLKEEKRQKSKADTLADIAEHEVRRVHDRQVADADLKRFEQMRIDENAKDDAEMRAKREKKQKDQKETVDYWDFQTKTRESRAAEEKRQTNEHVRKQLDKQDKEKAELISYTEALMEERKKDGRNVHVMQKALAQSLNTFSKRPTGFL